MSRWGRKPTRSDGGEAEQVGSIWASEVPSTDRAMLSWDTAGHEPAPDEPTGADDEAPWRRTAVIGVGIIAVMAVLIATVIALSSPDGEGDDEAATDEPVPETTLDTLPPLVTTTEVPAEPEPAADEQPEAPAVGTGSGTGLGSQPEPLVSTVDLPEVLAGSAEPYEVVMTSSSGLVTLSIPSGVVRTTPIGGLGTFPYRTVLVAPDAALVVVADGQTDPVIVRDDGAVFAVDGLADDLGYAAGWSREDGTTSFHLGIWAPDTGELQNVEITTTGVVSQTAPAFSGFAQVLPNGDYLVDDAGGTYAVSPDGQGRRITADRLVGVGSGYLVTRYCTEQYDCGLATVAADGSPGVRFPPTDDDDFSLFFGTAAVPSPDGRSVVYSKPRTAAQQGEPPIDVVVTDDGSGVRVAEVTAASSFLSDQFGRPADTWAPDSSGYFRGVGEFGDDDSGGLVYVTVDGDTIPVPGVAEGITSLGIRTVDEEFRPNDASGLITIDDPDVADPGATVGLLAVRDGTATHIDPAAGTRSTWAMPSLGDGPDLALVDGAVIGISRAGDIATRLRQGEVIDVLSGVSPRIARPRFASSTDRLTWRRVADEDRYELVPITFHDIGGRTAWAQIDVDSRNVYGTDGDGRLVYRDDEGVRAAGANDAELITTGELIAIGRSAALVSECDPDCTSVLIGADGSRQPVAGPFGAAVPIDSDGQRLSDGTVSPDGEVFVFSKADESGERWFAFDTAAAVEAEIPRPALARPIIWSPDSQRAYFISDGRVHVWERGSFSTRPLDSVGDVDAIVAVPLDFGSNR